MSEVNEDPYPSRFAMEAAVELEIHSALGRVETQTVGKVIQWAIDKALAARPTPAAEGGRASDTNPPVQWPRD